MAVNEPPSDRPDNPSPVVYARPIVSTRPPLPPRPLELPTVDRLSALIDLSLIVLFAFVTFLALPVVFGVAWGLSVGKPTIEATQILIIVEKWMDVPLAVGFIVFLLWRNRMGAAAFGLRTDRPAAQTGWGFLTLGGVYVAFFGSAIVTGILVMMIPGLQQDLLNRGDFLEMMPVHNLARSVLLLIPVALHEELAFRGLLIPYLKRLGCGWIGAITISSFVFALLHIGQGWLGVIQIFSVGVAFGVFFVLSRSLVAVIIAHFLFDLIQFQVIRWMQPVLDEFAGNA